MTNRRRAFLTIALSLTFGLSIWLQAPVAGQSTDGKVSPMGVVFDPCLIQPRPPQCAPAPTPDPRKGLALGVTIRRDELDEQVQDLRGPNRGRYPNAKPNIEIIRESRTGWVRLFADWPSLQPEQDFSFDNLYFDERTRPFIESLDGQIVFARQNNLKVILAVHHRFPLWSNGTPDQECPDRCGAETDPVNKAECERLCGMANDPNAAHLKLTKPRNPFGRVPADLGIDSPWGRWVTFLVRRYGYSAETRDTLRYVDYLEVVNEPNLTMWPQWKDDKVGNRRDIRGRLVIAGSVARMFVTAQEIVSRRNVQADVLDAEHDTTVKLAGPAASDVLDPKPGAPGASQEEKERKKRVRVMRTGYETFTRELLVQLRRERFNPKSYFSFSHHDYADVERSRRAAPAFDPKTRTLEDPTGATNSAAWVRELLRVGTGEGRANRWTGWPDAEHPGLLITEGGARLSKVGDQDTQADLVDKNFKLLLSEGGRLRAGIGLSTQYLTFSDICFDSGLFSFIEPQPTKPRDVACAETHGFTGGGGGPRKVYETWVGLTSTSKNPVP